MQEADDGEDEAHQYFQPYHPNVCVAKHRATTSPVDVGALLYGRPCCQPAEADGESPGD